MFVIRLSFTNLYLEEISLDGSMKTTQHPYDAKLFTSGMQLRVYTDFLDNQGYDYEVQVFNYTVTKAR